MTDTPPPPPADRARDLFLTAIELDDAARGAFLDAEIGADTELRARVEGLLRAHAAATGLFGESRLGPEPDEPLDVGARIGDYTLVRRLGEGGFGVVYLAEQHAPIQRQVALKIVKPGTASASVVQRFAVERQSLAKMDHPGIATVYDAGTTEEGLPYFALEFVDGEPITEFCDSNALTIRARLELFEQVCVAVQHAHQKGVIHRDLKPGNVLVAARAGQPPAPKIIDFGIAKALHDHGSGATLTGAHQLVGTPEYMAPEQIDHDGPAPDTRTDVYSLGVLLYRLLCGVPPFDPQVFVDRGPTAWARLITETAPKAPSARLRSGDARTWTIASARGADPDRLARACRQDLDWITLRALEPDPERRYPTAYALGADIAAHLDHQPIDAGPPARLHRLLKFCRRHLAVVSAALVIFVLAIVAAAVSGRAAFHANLARLDAEQTTYRASIHAAAAALARYDALAAGYHLAAAPAELRGWEWEHLDRQIDRSAFTVRRTALGMKVAFAAGGGYACVQGGDGELSVHRLPDGEMLGHARAGLGRASDVAIAPDGTHVYCADERGRVRVWAWADGPDAFRDVDVHDGRVYRMALLSNGRQLLTSGADGFVRMWRLPEFELAREFGHPAPVHAVHANVDMGLLATSCWDQKVRLFELETGKLRFANPMCRAATPIRPAKQFTIGRVDSMALTEHGLLTGCRDGLVCLSHLETGARIWEDGTHRSRVTVVDGSPNGALSVSACRDGTVSLIRLHDGRFLAKLDGHVGEVTGVGFLPAGDRIYTTSEDQSIVLWDLNTRPLVTLTGHEDFIREAALSQDGRWLATVALDGQAKFWSLEAAAEEGLILTPANLNAVAFESETNLIVGDVAGRVGRWSPNGGARKPRDVEGVRAISCGAVAPGGGHYVVGTSRSGLKVLDLETDAVMHLEPASGRVLSVAWSADGQWIVSGWFQGAVRLHRRGEPELVYEVVEQRGAIRGVGFLSASGATSDPPEVVSVGADRTVAFWRPHESDDTRKVVLGGIDGALTCLAVRPDDRVVAVGSTDRTIALLDVESGVVLGRLIGHSRRVSALAWMPRSGRLASGSADRTVRIWDADAGLSVITLRGHRREVNAIAVAPDESTIVSVGQDGVVRRWLR